MKTKAEVMDLLALFTLAEAPGGVAIIGAQLVEHIKEVTATDSVEAKRLTAYLVRAVVQTDMHIAL